jgi:hypothetical protein
MNDKHQFGWDRKVADMQKQKVSLIWVFFHNVRAKN